MAHLQHARRLQFGHCEAGPLSRRSVSGRLAGLPILMWLFSLVNRAQNEVDSLAVRSARTTPFVSPLNTFSVRSVDCGTEWYQSNALQQRQCSIVSRSVTYIIHMLLWLIEQGLTSHQTHYRSYRGRFLQVIWPNWQCQSTKGNQLVF